MSEDKKDTPAEKTEELPESKAVVEKTSSEVSVYDDYLEGSDDSHSDFSQTDFTVPFLGILQALSKALQKGHEKYVRGAEQGMVINSATRQVHNVEDDGLIVVPCAFQHRYIAWKPDNGGIAHDYGSDSRVYDSIEPNEKYKRIDADKNELVDTLEYFCLMVDRETGFFEACVIPFSGTFAKKSRMWNNKIRAHVEMKNGRPVKPPIYFYSYEVRTVPESNEKGSWYSWDIDDYKRTPELVNGREIFQAAKELRASVTSGTLKAATEEPDAGEDSGDGAF